MEFEVDSGMNHEDLTIILEHTDLEKLQKGEKIKIPYKPQVPYPGRTPSYIYLQFKSQTP